MVGFCRLLADVLSTRPQRISSEDESPLYQRKPAPTGFPIRRRDPSRRIVRGLRLGSGKLRFPSPLRILDGLPDLVGRSVQRRRLSEPFRTFRQRSPARQRRHLDILCRHLPHLGD